MGRSGTRPGGSDAGAGSGAAPSLIRAPRPHALPPCAVNLATRRALRSAGESDGSEVIGPGVTSGWASAFSGSPNSHSKLAGPIPRLSGVIEGAGSGVIAGAGSGVIAGVIADAGAGGAAAGSGARATCICGASAAISGDRATCTGGGSGWRSGRKGE
jgi:hypothetical protein